MLAAGLRRRARRAGRGARSGGGGGGTNTIQLAHREWNRADGKQSNSRPGTAVKPLWPAVNPALAGEHVAISGPVQAFKAIRNRHWNSPGRYHNKLPTSPGMDGSDWDT
jgi:hypothetical protein